MDGVLGGAFEVIALIEGELDVFLVGGGARKFSESPKRGREDIELDVGGAAGEVDDLVRGEDGPCPQALMAVMMILRWRTSESS